MPTGRLSSGHTRQPLPLLPLPSSPQEVAQVFRVGPRGLGFVAANACAGDDADTSKLIAVVTCA